MVIFSVHSHSFSFWHKISKRFRVSVKTFQNTYSILKMCHDLFNLIYIINKMTVKNLHIQSFTTCIMISSEKFYGIETPP